MDTVIYTLKTIQQEKDFKISNICSVKSSKSFIYFDKLDDGTWRMVYTKGELKEYV